MRAIFIFWAVFVWAIGLGHAQSTSWAWARYANNSKIALNSKVGHDGLGNLYTVGLFTGSIAFSDSVYQAKGIQGMTVVKYDPNGHFKWSRGFNGTGTVAANAMLVDRNGDIYIGGFYTKKITLGDSVFTSKGGQDIFLFKVDSSGNIIWAKTYGANNDDEVGGLAMDSKHNILLTGYFSDSTIDIGGTVLRNANTSTETLILKHDSTGILIWAKQGKSKSDDNGSGIAVDKQDNIYVAGNFDVSISFDAVKTYSISSGFVLGDIYIAKFDSSGNTSWVTVIGGYKEPGSISGGDLYPPLLTIDTSGYPIVGSQFSGCCMKFNHLIIPDPINPDDAGGMWFGKFDPFGNLDWAKIIPGSSYDYTHEMICDNVGDIYLGGEYYFTRGFDADTAYFPIGSPVGLLFIAKYLNNGDVAWIQTAGDSSCGAVAFDIAVPDRDEVAVAGQFYGGNLIKFGSITCMNTGTYGNGFVAKVMRSLLNVPNVKMGEYRIAPNPATNELTLWMSQSAKFDEYLLVNCFGQIVDQRNLNKQLTQQISLPSVASGIYHLILRGHGVLAESKVCIQQ